MIAASTTKKLVDPIEVFRQRADARAYLFAVGEYELLDAVDVLQASAEADGLVDHLPRLHPRNSKRCIPSMSFRFPREAARMKPPRNTTPIARRVMPDGTKQTGNPRRRR
jgi:hypothetical protein